MRVRHQCLLGTFSMCSYLLLYIYFIFLIYILYVLLIWHVLASFILLFHAHRQRALDFDVVNVSPSFIVSFSSDYQYIAITQSNKSLNHKELRLLNINTNNRRFVYDESHPTDHDRRTSWERYFISLYTLYKFCVRYQGEKQNVCIYYYYILDILLVI